MKADDKNVASITSLVGRLPTFDFYNHNGFCYMRIKREVIFAMSNYEKVYIVPTDDLRIKFLVIPVT